MYCTTCGAQNPASANYCYKDGTALQKEKISFAYTKNQKTFCPYCGYSLLSDCMYCSSCGSPVFQVHIAKSENIRHIKEEDEANQKYRGLSISSLLDLCKSLRWKRVLLAVSTSFIVLFLLSAMAIKGMKSSWFYAVNPGLRHDLEYVLSYLDRANIEKLNWIKAMADFTLWTHAVNPEIKMNAAAYVDRQVGEAGGSVETGLIRFLIIPFLALFVGGVVLAKAWRTNMRTLMGHLIVFSFLYGTCLSILSLVASFSYEMNTNDHGLISFHITGTYPFWTTLVNGVLLSFFFAGTGIWISRGYKRTVHEIKQFVRYGDVIYSGCAWQLRGIGLLFVLLLPFVFLGISRLEIDELEWIAGGAVLSKLFYAALAMQWAVWLWAMLHLGVLHFQRDNLHDHQSVTYGLFSDLKPISNDTGFYEEIYDWLFHTGFFEKEIYMQLLILLPIAIFLYVGYRIRQNYELVWKPIVVFAALYSIGLVVICQFSRLGISYFVSVNGETEVKRSMALFIEPLTLLVKCFIFSLLFTFAGSWLQQFAKQKRGMK
ncbi:zinc ribbon domain-containing protein [Geobacillus icigianus]|uniref:DZANK-type domain-containing protein n=1 Tax=Geobacillus icigianus TaxID=1430331 RepID=A0ABU6BG06_9BACL|nr:zinc ribbon domain-containing protein [Geobacillus icigianus]MEB3750847.1 hypothetical protein [Geobacillus icigianus]